jgi:hypothetical protein
MGSRLAAAVLSIALTASAFAASDPTYTALRNARPDGRSVALHDFAFDRDVYHVVLNGTLHLLAPVDGKSVGAVFTGQGSYELTPASETERRLLAVNADVKDLVTFKDDFDSMVVFDSALIQQAGTASAGAPSPDASSKLDRFLQAQKKDFTTNLQLRVLQSMLNGEAATPFIAYVAGKKTPAVLVVDRLGAEATRMVAELASEETVLYSADRNRGGFWYSSHLRGEKPHVIEPLARAAHYAIDTTIRSNDELEGTATIDVIVGAESLRVLPVWLLTRLRVDEASFAATPNATQWTPIAFVQEAAKEDGDLAVIFPQSLQPRQTLSLRLKYHGREVLESAGDGNYFVNARSSWYPNLGAFTSVAPFDLTYRMPKAFQVVSVGEPVSDTVQADQRVAVFKTAQPIRVAGFNYGKFKKVSKSDKESGVTIDVYTNTGTPDIIREINLALESARDDATTSAMNDPYPGGSGGYVGPSFVKLDTDGLAEAAIADAFYTARVGKLYFGSVPSQRVAIAQQSQWSFGQSWPQLIYMPYIAVLSSTTRAQMGMMDAASFVDQVGSHEFAHQWWGHTVSPATYHDAWLSEGFADFTAALVSLYTGGPRKYNAIWEQRRKSIVERPRGAFVDSDKVGPLTTGFRLTTWRNQSAYPAMVYSKGAYVLHMLRTMMLDFKSQPPDKPFMEAMTDFTTAYAGKNATTEDFKHALERHMVPTLNATGDGKLDWFFDQWVYGTDIPRLKSALKAETGSAGKVRISGSITQSEVGENFKVLVPIYAELDKGVLARVGTIPMIGNSTRQVTFEVSLPKPPRAVTINALHDVLAR